MKQLKRILASISIGAFLTLVFWVGGVEFYRGPDQGLLLLIIATLMGCVYFFPGWDE